MHPEGHSEELVSFVEEIGLFYEDLGLTRIWGRVLGYLLVCEPDAQSAEELAQVLHVSRGSISMTTKALVRAGMVERQTVRGDRRTYFRIRPEAWTEVFEEQIRSAARMRELAEQGLGLLDNEAAERRRRLEQLQEFTAFYEREIPALLARWRTEHQQNIQQDA
ncbi:MAG: MarR family transcriptional regulator [Actinomycetota bacterium]|nr:MarR family transcriptional regulator [Actinomycetota bacterium]